MAVHSTTVEWNCSVSEAIAAVQGFRWTKGSIWASSKIMTLLARLWSFRHLEERLA